MTPINVYEKKQMEQVRNAAPEKKTMRGFIRIINTAGKAQLINAQAISVVEPDDDDTTIIWLVDRNDPVEVNAPFNTVVGYIWKAMEV